jgi:RNA polymerase sigma factor (sigma-70 family)
MEPTDDSALLRQFAENNSEEAFAVLVTKYINLVYSVAMRRIGNPASAEEITQAVFIILARKAGQLRNDKALSSWLFKTTQLTANNFLRSEMRRQSREQEAHNMQTILNEPEPELWPKIAPLLDNAVAALNEKDRRAILLRFYDGKNLREIGTLLGSNEPAAEKRVSRALEKLRRFFTKRGVSSTTAIIAGTISANSVQAAPVMLAKTVTAVAIVKGTAASVSTLTLIKGALKVMAWTKIKTATVSVLVLTGLVFTPLVIHREIRIHSGSSSLGADRWSKDSLANEGYRTPKSALKTLLWATSHGDYDAFMASCTPEARDSMEKDLQNVPKNTFAANFKSKFAPVTGFQIVSQTNIAPDLVEIDYYLEGVNQTKKVKFQKIGDEWKLSP